MTLDQVRIFVAIAETMHVTRAARGLGLTQSAASAALAALEMRHGLALFDRVGRHLELTPAGRAFLPEARALLATAARAKALLEDLSGLRCGHLTLFASQTLAGYWLPARLHQFHQAYPGIALTLLIGNTAQACAAVRDGMADLGFVEGRITDPALTIRPLGGDQLVLVVGAGHPAAWAGSLAPAALAELDWVLREPGSGTRQRFEAALSGFGIDPARLRVALQLPSNEAVRGAVEAGAGASVLSDLVAASGLRAGTLVALDLPFPTRAFTLIRHHQRVPSRAETALTALLDAALSSEKSEESS